MDKKRKKGKEKVNIVKLINNIIESKICYNFIFNL